MGSRSAGLAPFPPEGLAEYLRCLSLPTIDPEHDHADLDAGRHLELLPAVLWGAEGRVGRCFDPLVEWRRVATGINGRALSGGH